MTFRFVGAKPLYEPVVANNLLDIGSKIQWNLTQNATIFKFSYAKMTFKMSPAKRRPFCLGLNVLKYDWILNVNTCSLFYKTLLYTVDNLKVRSHMHGADESGGGWKIGFNTNHYMRSHIRGRGAQAEREQNPPRNKWVQHPIFRVRFETARSKPSLSSRNGRSARVRSAYVWTYPR